MKKLAMMIPLFLILSLMVAPIASAQNTYTLEMSDMPNATVTHNGEIYQLASFVGLQNCQIRYNGVVSETLFVGDIVGELKVTKITMEYVTLESELPDEEEPKENDENIPTVSEQRYKLDSGDVLLFSDSGGVNGAMGYVFGETLSPTFLFWAGGRLPTITKTPVPDEKVSLGKGQSYTSQAIWDLTLTVESIDIDRVIVVFETDDSISLMKTTTGGEDITELVERLWAEYQAKFPESPATVPIDMSGLWIIGGVFSVYVGYLIVKDRYVGWGRS